MSLGYTGLHLPWKIISSLINPAGEKNTSLVDAASPIMFQCHPTILGFLVSIFASFTLLWETHLGKNLQFKCQQVACGKRSLSTLTVAVVKIQRESVQFTHPSSFTLSLTSHLSLSSTWSILDLFWSLSFPLLLFSLSYKMTISLELLSNLPPSI